jgi:AcrR family transcriptional regulator
LAERIAEEQVLEGARRALARFGHERATLERIAQEAGVSRVTLHRRGVTREGILAALAERAAEEYQQALWPALTSRGTGRARLERALKAVCEVAEANLALLMALQAQSDAIFHAEPSDDREEVETRWAFTEPLERLLIDGQADGTLRAGDPLEIATVLFNQVGWTYLHLRSGHRWAPERALRAVVELALDGVGTC